MVRRVQPGNKCWEKPAFVDVPIGSPTDTFQRAGGEKNARTHDANCVLHASDRKGGDFALTSKSVTLYEMIELRRNHDRCIEVFAVDRFGALLGQTAGHLRHIYRKFTTACDTTDP